MQHLKLNRFAVQKPKTLHTTKRVDAGAKRNFHVMSDLDEDVVAASDDEDEMMTAPEVLQKLEEVRVKSGIIAVMVYEKEGFGAQPSPFVGRSHPWQSLIIIA